MRKTCIFSFSGYKLEQEESSWWKISCRNEPKVTGQVAEPRLELRRAVLRHTDAPWREASQNSLTSASSTCTEDEGQSGGPCFPQSVAVPRHSAQHSAPLLLLGPLETPGRFPSGNPNMFPNHLPSQVLRGSHGPQGCLTSACVGDAVHRPLHVGLVLGVAQDQALLPACQSPVDRAQSVSKRLLWAALQKDVDVAGPHAACGKGRTLDPGTGHTLNPRAHTLKASVK